MKKLLAMLLATMLLGAGALCGCKTVTEWEVNTAEIEGGPLYTLQEIYEARAIRYRDFLNIAYYNGDRERNKRVLRNFEPEPIGELSEEISLKIRESLAKHFRDIERAPEATANDFTIVIYLGCYNGYYAFRYSDAFTGYPENIGGHYSQEVGEILYTYSYSSSIRLWKDN